MKITNQHVIDILSRLHKAGFKAYIAGGAVRDMVLGKEPTDYDIVTNALPDQIQKIVPNTKEVGKHFGVILARRRRKFIEIATFRQDLEYKDGRRPSKINFSDEEEDAFRRDFTINGMFYDYFSKKVIDYVGGKKDIEQKILRFIGDPKKRISEDYLRILRAVRFKNSLGFHYHEQTFQALHDNSFLIQKLAKERVYEELKKLFELSNCSEMIQDLDVLHLLHILFPELLQLKGVRQGKKYHQEGDVWIHTLLALESLPKKVDYLVRLGVLFHDIAKPNTFHIDDEGHLHFYGHNVVGAEMTRKMLQRWKFSKEEIETVEKYVKYHMLDVDLLLMNPRKRNSWFAKDMFPDIFHIFRADGLGVRPKNIKNYHTLKKMYTEWKKAKENHIENIISGKDIIETFGIKEGKEIGELLKIIQTAYLSEKIHSKKEALEKIRLMMKDRKNEDSV